MKIELRPEIKLIQLFLKKELEPAEGLLRGGDIDWDVFVKLLSYHETAPYLYIRAKPLINLFPSKPGSLLFNSYWHTVRDNVLKNKEYQVLYNIFQDKKIELLPIKGIALLNDIYAGSCARPMVDIDVLVRGEEYGKSEEILQNLGYEKKLMGLAESYWRDKQCHMTFRGPRNTIELHWGLDFKRQGRTALADVWKRLREVDAGNGAKLRLLSPEDTLFSLALHQRRRGKVFCLKYIVDTALILRKYRETFDWDYVIESCKREHLSSCLYFFILQAKIFFDSDEFDAALNKLAVPCSKKKLMGKFIASNINSHLLRYKHNDNYLKSHFLIYDSYIEPLKYIINIPLEQFAKFYNLEPYAIMTRIFYRLRFVYFAFYGLVRALKFTSK